MAMFTVCVTFADLRYMKLCLLMLFQFCAFIEMVKLLEHKHFKITLHVFIHLNFLFVYFTSNSLKLWTTHIFLNIVLEPITGDVMNIVTLSNWQEEFEDTKGVIIIVYRRRTDNTVAKRKRTKGQTTIYKTYI